MGSTVARLEEGAFKGAIDEQCVSSPQTRASHGTRMMAPEELAEEYGRKKWKYFMSDTGMACRSGMTHVGQHCHFLPLLFWTLNLLHENMKKALLASCWAGCSREQLWFHRNRTCFFYIYLISLWQLVLFYLTFCWYSFFLLLFWSKKIAFRNNAFLSDLYFYQFVICSVLTFVSPSSISPCIRITHLSFFLEFSCLLSVLVSSPFVFLFSLLGMILCIFPSL